MKAEMISSLEAQLCAEQQTPSAVVPLSKKSFILNEASVKICDFIQKMDLEPEQIEKICSMDIGEYYTLLNHRSVDVLKRIK